MTPSKRREVVRRTVTFEFGPNPFLPIITVTGEPTPQRVRRVIDSGIDGLLILPVSTTLLLNRIRTLVKNRKKFVVTTDYIGPDRRRDSLPRPGSQVIPLIDVPNTLRNKILRGSTDKDIGNRIAEVWDDINLQKIERHGGQIEYLVDHIAAVDPTEPFDKSVGPMLSKMIWVCEDIQDRAADTAYWPVCELGKSLAGLASRLLATGAYPDSTNQNRLMALSFEIQTFFIRHNSPKASRPGISVAAAQASHSTA